MIYAALLIISVITIVITILPVLKRSRLVFPADSLDKSIPLEERKRSIYKALGEIEFDYKMNKLSEKDYKRFSNMYRKKAVDLLKSEEKQSAVDDIDAEIEIKLDELRRTGLRYE